MNKLRLILVVLWITSIVMLIYTIAISEARAETVRSHKAITTFKKAFPCPANGATKGPCPGYVIDHIIPLACSGPDVPANMQWQTIAAGKWKDSWERKDCGIWYRMPRD